MAISKLILNGVTQMDLTGDTVVADKLLSPYTAHGADGEPITGTSTAIVPTGTKSITANGTGIDVTSYASVDVAVPTGGTTKNIQVYSGYDETNSNTYVATDVSITVSKAGSYKCSWTGLRNTTSGTSGSQLYKNDSAVGSAHASGWIRSYGQYCEETLTLAAEDVLTVYARARASNYYMVVGNLIIQEQ